jgi:hypothetical protein
MLTKAPRRSHGRSVKGQAQQLHRIKVADAFLNGTATIAELAIEHCVSIYTVRDWVRDRREYPNGAASKRAMQMDAALTAGLCGSTGGAMSNEAVRAATRDLEKAIIALQQKRRMPTFSYRREPEA